MNIPSLNIVEDDNKPDAQQWGYFRQRDFRGGENRLLLPESLKADQLQLAYNCIISADGLPQTRTGKSAIHTTALSGAITSIHRYSTEAGATKLLVQCGTVLYVYAYDGSTQFDSWTQLATGLNAAKFRSVTWKNKIYLTNGSDNVKVYDGSTFADLAGSPPKSKVIKIYGGRMYLVDVANPNNLRFSDLEDPTVWDILNVFNIRSGDNDEIVGISPQPGGLVIFKNHTIWVLTGTSLSNFRLTESPISSSVGCVSPDTILDEGMFLGVNNVYTFTTETITAVADTHKSVIASVSLAAKQAAFACYSTKNRHALLHLGSFVLCLDEALGCITTWASLDAKCFCMLDAKEDDGSILVGDATNGVVYRMDDSSTDDGAPIRTQVTTAYLDYGFVGRKLWRFFQPEIESLSEADSIIRYNYDVDYNAIQGSESFPIVSENSLTWDVSSWDQANWGGTVRMTDKLWLHNAYGNRIAFSIVSTDRVKYLGYTTKFREAGSL